MLAVKWLLWELRSLLSRLRRAGGRSSGLLVDSFLFADVSLGGLHSLAQSSARAPLASGLQASHWCWLFGTVYCPEVE